MDVQTLITLLPTNAILLGLLILLVALPTGILWLLSPRYPHLNTIAQMVMMAGLLLGAALIHPLLALILIAGWLLLDRWQLPVMPLPDWAWLLALAVIARLPRLTAPLWYDEAFTAYLARLPAARLGEAMIQGDVHPPLWTTIEWLLKFVIGRSEAALRLPALLFSLLAVLLIYRLALRLNLGQRTAQLSGLLLALLPAQIYFGDEARAYSLLVCLVLGMTLAILEDRPAWFLLCGALIGWTHNLGFLYLGMLGVFALVYQRRLRWLISVCAAGLLTLPWLPFLLIQTRDVSQDYWIQPLLLPGVLRPLFAMTVGQELPAVSILLLYIPIILLTLLALRHSVGWIRTHQGLVWLGLAAGIPLILALIAALWKPLYLPRTLLPCVTAWVIAWAWVLVHSSFARRLMVALLAVGLWVFYGQSRPPFAANLSACEGADSAYFINTTTRIAADYYLPISNQLLWEDAYNYADGLSPEAVRGLGLAQGDISDLEGDICVVYHEAILSTERERAELARVLALYPDAASFNRGFFQIYRITR
ncbi:MAG: glycosyltransferase family 39 protein [Anaerolineae bacterium]|nr:glycosyltransferase family 39 protein [Anaerolineae bacterium]